MEALLSQLLNTICLRPYVFIFLAAYLIGCSMQIGLKRALLFIPVGYLITWISEFSSINTGFPYGWYYYIESTKGYELWVLGVPFMDSLSYVFLTYASYSMALFIMSPMVFSKKGFYLLENRKMRRSFSTALLATTLMVYLDIIIDPVALQGSKWFLGQIYGYPGGGAYFGVPISNFAGWFVVGLLLVRVFQFIDSLMAAKDVRDYAAYGLDCRFLIGPGLYLGILVFNLFMTFYIGDMTLGWVGLFIVSLPAVLIAYLINSRLERSDISVALETHLKDFPSAIKCITVRDLKERI